jgi:hypothetical protein
MPCISIVRCLYFKIFSASFWFTFLSHGIATSINIHVPFSLTRITMSGLLLGMVLSVCTCWFHSMVTLLVPPRLVSTALVHVHTVFLYYYYYYYYYFTITHAHSWLGEASSLSVFFVCHWPTWWWPIWIAETCS